MDSRPLPGPSTFRAPSPVRFLSRETLMKARVITSGNKGRQDNGEATREKERESGAKEKGERPIYSLAGLK